MEYQLIPLDQNPIGFMGSNKQQQQLEQTIYYKAKELSQSYLGGAWEYFDCGRNAIFMAPAAGNYLLRLGSKESLSSPAFGMLASVMGMEVLSVNPRYQFLNYRVQRLKENISTHPEAMIMAKALEEFYGEFQHHNQS